jgi:hypothetical protein
MMHSKKVNQMAYSLFIEVCDIATPSVNEIKNTDRYVTCCNKLKVKGQLEQLITAMVYSSSWKTVRVGFRLPGSKIILCPLQLLI